MTKTDWLACSVNARLPRIAETGSARPPSLPPSLSSSSELIDSTAPIFSHGFTAVFWGMDNDQSSYCSKRLVTAVNPLQDSNTKKHLIENLFWKISLFAYCPTLPTHRQLSSQRRRTTTHRESVASQRCLDRKTIC